MGVRYVLPKGIAKLAWVQKPLTKSRAERMQVAWLFASTLAGSFFLFTLANLLFSIIGNKLSFDAALEDAVKDTLADLAYAVSNNAEQVFDGYIVASRYVSFHYHQINPQIDRHT